MIIFMVLIITGYVLSRKNILGPEFVKGSSYLILNVFVSASILNSVLGERPELSASAFLNAFLCVFLLIILGYALAGLCIIPVKGREKKAQLEILMSVTNTLFVGLPIVSMVYGSEAVFYVGMSCVPYNLVLYSYGIWRLVSGKGEGKVRPADMLTISLGAAVLALIIFVLNLRVPEFICELVSTVSGGTVPLSMLVIGASLGRISPKEAFSGLENYLVSLERLIICPLTVYFVLSLVSSNEVLIFTCTVLAGTPVAAITTPLSIRYGYDGEKSSKSIMVSTVLSMVTIPLLIKLLF